MMVVKIPVYVLFFLNSGKIKYHYGFSVKIFRICMLNSVKYYSENCIVKNFKEIN